MVDDAERVRGVAQEIQRYLMDHPNAADSMEGVASWWLSRQRVHYELELVKSALEYLKREGVVSATPGNGDGNSVYRLNKIH